MAVRPSGDSGRKAYFNPVGFNFNLNAAVSICQGFVFEFTSLE